MRTVGYIGAYPTVLYIVPLGLGYAHAVCGISRINHTYSEDVQPGISSLDAVLSAEDIWVHILLLDVVYHKGGNVYTIKMHNQPLYTCIYIILIIHILLKKNRQDTN